MHLSLSTRDDPFIVRAKSPNTAKRGTQIIVPGDAQNSGVGGA